MPLKQTSLVLEQEAEAKLVQRALDRIQDLRAEMGIDAGGGVQANSWAWERQKNRLQSENEFSWREAEGGIFQYSNFSLNIAKRYMRLMAAKTNDDLIGTEPFFAAMPTEHGDPALSKDVEWFIQEKVACSNLKASVGEGQAVALSENEVVIKPSWITNSTHFRGPATVMVGANGQPFLTPKGDYVYPKDDVIPDPNVAEVPVLDANGQPQVGADGQPMTQPAVFRLKKEPQVTMPRDPQFAPFPDLDQVLTAYEGLDVRALDFRDFLCPLAVNSVHEADICVHLFDESPERLRATYGMFEVTDNYFNTTQLSGEKQARTEKGEQESGSRVLRYVNCADVYMRCNPFEGTEHDLGIESEIWMLLDLTNQKPIWYDFLGNHMKKRPFEVIPGVEKVPNRWYGVGVFELLKHKQLYIDTQFNRVNFKSSKSSTIRFRNVGAVSQWKNGEELVVGDDQFYDITDSRFDARNPPAFQVNLAEIDPFAMRLMEVGLQSASTEVGIVGPDDGNLSGLDSTKLATGIKSLERTGNVLMKYTERAHGEAIERILNQAVDIILEHMDEDELIYRPDTDAIIALNREEIRRLERDVKLLLTRSRSTETLETSRAVIQLCREYYEALTPFERHKLRDEYIRQLKALEVQDAAARLDEVTKEQAYAWLAQQSKPPVTPPKESIATKYGDLARSEQEQVLTSQGITPATPAQLATTDAHEVAKEGALAEAKAAAQPAPAPAKKAA